jgi:DNA primase
MADDRPSELLLTYAELGDRFGINADAARFRAKRAKWPIVTGNDGRVRVRITPEQLPERPPERTPDARASNSDLLAELRRSYAERTAELIARAENTEREAEHWRAKAEQARSEVERHRAIAELIREQLAREIERGDAAIAELRRPWWRRLIG